MAALVIARLVAAALIGAPLVAAALVGAGLVAAALIGAGLVAALITATLIGTRITLGYCWNLGNRHLDSRSGREGKYCTQTAGARNSGESVGAGC